MVLIYCPRQTNRLTYTVQFIFEDILQMPYQLTSDSQSFIEYTAAKINYSRERISKGELFIYAHGLLEQDHINAIEIPMEKDSERVHLFPNKLSDLGFDLFSSIFYMVSRYEEYLPFKRDKHGRFEANQSFAYQHGFLNRPVVDEWIIELKNALSIIYPNLTWKEDRFTCQPTIDIDQLFAIQEKSLIRFLKPVFISLLSLNFSKLFYLIKVRFGLEKDPFNQLERLESIHKKFGLKAKYFILFSRKYNTYDINISVKNKKFRKAIRELAKTASIGIHPSYQSHYDYRIIDDEINSLSNLLNITINSSRQHYLKMKLPNTYKSILNLGIVNEYTMGFASMPGFRAGTTHSFRFYDIKHEQTTFLRVHPFCVMDATFKTYLHYSEEQAYNCIVEIIDNIKKVNGVFTTLWHNESMSGYGVWDGWSNLYERILSKAMDK
jgi:hypothetical protein